MRTSLRLPVVLLLILLAGACTLEPQAAWLGEPEPIAPGVELFRASDPTLIDPAGPVLAYLLRLNPERVRLESALAHESILGAESVAEIAARRGAVAAVNGGFFNEIGEPIGLLKVAGELVSDTGVTKGAVAIRSPDDGPTELVFDQLSVRMALQFESDGRTWNVPIDGVDTTRARGRLMLYTPSYHTNTDTAPNGTEWILGASPLRVLEVRLDEGRAPIPRDGIALSYGGLSLPEALVWLLPGVEVTVETTWQAVHSGSTDLLADAEHVIGGAGLLRRNGRLIADWESEGLPLDSFVNARHPRTLIGMDRRGYIWLAVIDGRQPSRSAGMTLADLQRLGDRLELTDALNLDGGGSTTMVVDGEVVNRPSDPAGPRPVSDAILVMLR
jgi:hypothetical protein